MSGSNYDKVIGVRRIFRYSAMNVGVAFALVVLCIYAYRYSQPNCEPCIPGMQCPPCISALQIFIAAVGGVLSLYVIALIAIPRRDK